MSTLINANYHTHTILCDGINTPEEMVLSAIEKNFDTLGFSGHCYTSYDESYCMSIDNTRKYISDIRRLKALYSDKIEILCGIEQDFGSDLPVTPYDYAIGSVHAVFDINPNGTINKEKYYYVDMSPEIICSSIDRFFDGDPYNFCERYYKMVSLLPEVTGCNIIGHFDLITKFNETEHIFDENHPRYISAVDSALEMLLKHKLIFEINTGAMARGYRSSPYPSCSILKKISSAGGSVIINSDCHNADYLDFAFDDAAGLAHKCGFNSVKKITSGKISDIIL